MQALKCACGGPLRLKSDGKTAVCDYCGTEYYFAPSSVKFKPEDFEIRAGVLEKYHGEDTEIVIPNGVKAIGEKCFSDSRFITSVVLPDGLREIANWAFSGCSSLEEIKLPDSVTGIGYRAFCECKSLKKINIPDSVLGIGEEAFVSCSALKEVIISVETFNRLCPPLKGMGWYWNVFQEQWSYEYGISPPLSTWYGQLRNYQYSLIRKQAESFRMQNRCQHCGGTFMRYNSGIQRCTICGAEKDY